MRREDPFLACDEGVHEIVYDTERAETICSKCGLVLDEMRLDFLIESNAVRRRRNSHAGVVKSLKASTKKQLLERELREAFLKHDVQKVVQEKALELFHVVLTQRFRTGYAISTFSEALIYCAHRLCRVPLTFNGFAGESDIAKKRIARCYQNLRRKLELNVPRFEWTDYLSQLARRKKVDDETARLAADILKKARQKRLCGGRSPIGIAAAALYVAGTITEKRITQKEFAVIAGVSDVTIRANCHAFKRLLQVEDFDER